ncbi:hypothetical protein C1D09_021980 [Mesorhizobium intechi]|uniref:Uncharacterized protein n=1 Tax=Mesorhizobium intechi TaxID=537601 RepID=A0A8T9AMM0_9HYPH|nr:hypothetical protein [Mesorhizobium intechi]TSE05662.1 hypothetical protein C1D09_021980 [Mesorhizobium intechi]
MDGSISWPIIVAAHPARGSTQAHTTRKAYDTIGPRYFVADHQSRRHSKPANPSDLSSCIATIARDSQQICPYRYASVADSAMLCTTLLGIIPIVNAERVNIFYNTIAYPPLHFNIYAMYYQFAGDPFSDTRKIGSNVDVRVERT